MVSWEELENACQHCRACPLAETRTNVVFGVGSRQAAENCAQRICEAVSRLSLSEHGVPTVSCSVGIAMVPEDGQDYNTLVRTADLRAYQAKAQGKNRYL